MPVYVDPLFTMTPKDAQAKRVGSRWCHMWADTLEELHEMAHAIGMKRAWFQDDPRLPHYDLSPKRREAAVREGAIEVGLRELRDAIQKHRVEMETRKRTIKRTEP